MAVTGHKKTDVSFPRQETWMTDVEGQQNVANTTSNSDDLFVIVEWFLIFFGICIAHQGNKNRFLTTRCTNVCNQSVKR